MTDIAKIAAGLSEAQKEAALQMSNYQLGCWLVDYFRIKMPQQQGKTPLGQQVRDHILGEQ